MGNTAAAQTSAMPDQAFTTPARRLLSPRVPRGAELLFKFVRLGDRAPMSCDLRFHGESYGWEAQFLERGELMYRCRGFATRAQAVQWAEQERRAMEVGE
jgi:hypothetical protein